MKFGRKHFSCDGSISLTNYIPKGMIEEGDTASASTDDDLDTCFLWRCTAVFADGRSAAWEVVEPWTEDRAVEYVEAADTLIPILSPKGKP